jgi:hypothetical protein
MKVILSLIALVLFNLGYSQDDEVKLRRAVANSKGIKKVDALLNYSSYYSHRFMQSKEADSLNGLALALAEKLTYKKGILLAQLNEASMLIDFEKNDESIYLYSELLKEYGDRDNSYENALILYDRSTAYMMLGKNKEASNDLLKALKYFDRVKNTKYQMYCYSKLSSIFAYEKQYSKSLEYINRVIEDVNKLDAPYDRASVFSSLSGRFLLLGFNLDSTYYDLSVEYGEKSYAIAKKYNYNIIGLADCQSTSQSYMNKGDDNRGLFHLKESLQFSKKLPANQCFVSFIGMADYYAGIEDYRTSLKYLDSAGRIQDLDNYYRMAHAERVYVYNKDYGRIAEALAGLENYKSFSDSVYKIEQSNQISELNTKYETESKDADIAKLNQQKRIDGLEIQKKRGQLTSLIAIGTVIILVFLIILFIVRQRNIRQSLQVLETEQRLNRARMNPHFFFNALTSIQTMMIKEKDLESTRYLSKFSKLMRQSLESSYQEMVTIEDEIEFLGHYIELQALRHPNVFEYSITCDDALAINEVMVPGMIIQPFIENSIEHGFRGMESGGKIEISFLKNEESLVITVKDNGKGEKDDSSSEKTHTSRAIDIISDRLFLLEKKEKKEASFEVLASADGIGYQIKLTLPLLFN